VHVRVAAWPKYTALLRNNDLNIATVRVEYSPQANHNNWQRPAFLFWCKGKTKHSQIVREKDVSIK
jgi:hypothetical protein